MNYEKVEAPKLAQHDATYLDLAFCMDSTGSMGAYIENARNSIREIVEAIVASEKSDVRLALVEYRDHKPQETTFVTRTHDFTASIKEMKEWLTECAAVGGGDLAEAVADGLNDCLKLNWRENATKICVLIADAPPHGLSKRGDTMPNGCSCGIDPVKVVSQLGEKGVILYSVGCEPAINPYKEFFASMAYKTGGQYVPLRNASLLSKVIIGGAQEEISLEKLMEDVQKEVQEQIKNGVLGEADLADAVHSKLLLKGARAKNLKHNNNALKFSEKAINYSKMESLSSLKSAYAETEETSLPRSFAMPTKSAKTKSRGGILSSLKNATIGKLTSSHKESTTASEARAEASFFDDELSHTIPSAHDTYNVEEESVNKEQVERLVKKALNRKKI